MLCGWWNIKNQLLTSLPFLINFWSYKLNNWGVWDEVSMAFLHLDFSFFFFFFFLTYYFSLHFCRLFCYFWTVFTDHMLTYVMTKELQKKRKKLFWCDRIPKKTKDVGLYSNQFVVGFEWTSWKCFAFGQQRCMLLKQIPSWLVIHFTLVHM